MVVVVVRWVVGRGVAHFKAGQLSTQRGNTKYYRETKRNYRYPLVFVMPNNRNKRGAVKFP